MDAKNTAYSKEPAAFFFFDGISIDFFKAFEGFAVPRYFFEKHIQISYPKFSLSVKCLVYRYPFIRALAIFSYGYKLVFISLEVLVFSK